MLPAKLLKPLALDLNETTPSIAQPAFKLLLKVTLVAVKVTVSVVTWLPELVYKYTRSWKVWSPSVVRSARKFAKPRTLKLFNALVLPTAP